MKKLLPLFGNYRYLPKLVLALIPFITFSVNLTGQVLPPDKQFEVVCNHPCSANDFPTIGDAYIVGAPSNCTTGDAVTAMLCIDFENGTGSDRQGIYFKALLSTGTTIRTCDPQTVSAGEDFTVCMPVTWTCGDGLTITDIFFAWNSGGTDNLCDATRCQDWPGSKCREPGGTIVIIPPCTLTPDDCNNCEVFSQSLCMCIDDPNKGNPGDPCTGPNPCLDYFLDDDCMCTVTRPKDPAPCGCPGGPQPGDRCDDGNDCTINDRLNDVCECKGTRIGNPGDKCDDGDPCTKDDKYDADCFCRGTPFAEPGDACDDGNACTINDKLDENCNCKGEGDGDDTIDTDKDGIPDCLDPCPYMLDDFVYADLKCGKAVSDNNIRGRSMFEEYGECSMPECPASGRELIYRLTTHSFSDLVITFKEDAHPQLRKLNLFVINDPCLPGCIAVLHAPRANGEGDQIVIENAPPGVYYIIVDGNQPYATNPFTLKVECVGGGAGTCPDNAHLYEDFDSYQVGKPITSLDPVHWSLFGSTSRSPMVSNDRASNGSQSLEFNRVEGGIQDANLDLGKKFRGAWKVSWDMYIEPMNTAHFGLFGGDFSDPWGTVSCKFNMTDTHFQGKWFDVELFVDLDNNKYVLFMHNRHFSKSGDYYLNLDFLNFYSPPGGHFYIDRICYAEVSSIPAPAGDRLADALYTNEELRDKLSAQEVSVFPNPAADEIYIDLRKYAGQAVNIKIYNSSSTEVFNRAIPEVTNKRERISLDGFTNGLHVISIQGKGVPKIAKKLVVSRLY